MQGPSEPIDDAQDDVDLLRCWIVVVAVGGKDDAVHRNAWDARQPFPQCLLGRRPGLEPGQSPPRASPQVKAWQHPTLHARVGQPIGCLPDGRGELAHPAEQVLAPGTGSVLQRLFWGLDCRADTGIFGTLIVGDGQEAGRLGGFGSVIGGSVRAGRFVKDFFDVFVGIDDAQRLE
ncbi:hypothetical protein D3C84_675890 [compost metagenome]